MVERKWTLRYNLQLIVVVVSISRPAGVSCRTDDDRSPSSMSEIITRNIVAELGSSFVGPAELNEPPGLTRWCGCISLADRIGWFQAAATTFSSSIVRYQKFLFYLSGGDLRAKHSETMLDELRCSSSIKLPKFNCIHLMRCLSLFWFSCHKRRLGCFAYFVAIWLSNTLME